MKKEFRRLASDSSRGAGDAAADAFPTGSGKEIRILFVEDVISDFELTVRELVQAGVAFAGHRVDTREGLLRELNDFEPDVILSDFSLPTFDGLSVLMIVRELRPDIPCIIVSGTISEDQLIELLRHGAADYVLKSNLERIPPAVLRAVQERDERAARRQAEQALKESEALLDSVFDNIPSMLFVKDAKDLRFVRFNRTGEELLGRSEKDLLGRNDHDFFPKEQADLFVAKDRETLASDKRVLILEEKIQVKDGTERILQTKKLPILDEQGTPRYLLGISEDITERKQAEQQIRDSEAKYRGLIEQASDGIFVSDAEGNFLFANSRWCELLGYAKDELTGMNARQTYLEEEREIHARHLEQVRAGQTLRYERVVQRKDGSTFPAEISLKMLDNGLIQGIFHDITTRRMQEQKIARLSRIQAVLSGINSAIVRIRDRQTLFDEVCRLSIEHGGFTLAWIRMATPDAQGGSPIAWRCANDSLLDLIPLSVETDAGRAHAERVMSEKRAAVYNDLTQASDFPFARQALQAGALSLAKLPLVVSGEAVGILALYANEAGVFDDEEMKLLNELVGDVSFGLEFIATEEQVNYLAYYDVLTKLPNRTLLHDRLGQYLHAAQRGQRMAAVMLIDLERFHIVNDTLGRNAADDVLREIATRLQVQIRAEDTVARVGADCFAIALSDASSTAEVAHAVHERVFAFLKQPPVRIGDQDLRPSAKFGVAVFPSDGSTAEALYSNAEAALKKAKESGERFLFYAPEMNARIAESLTLENKLRSAIDRGQFVLHYQPKVSLRGRKVVGLEALIRWKDPELGLVPPARFIPLMEETGLILDAGRWALSQVARDCRLWLANGAEPPRVAVNVSPIQLRQKDFVDIVIEAAETTRKAGSMLDLEITESVIMENVEAIIQKLQTIRELGVEIAVDDFGTGYSSLAYVARLPIHDLKIDRSFVVGITDNKDSLAIVKSVISLAHSLRLNVVAEGVETEKQAALLLELGCDEMQGYLFSPPMPPDKVPEFLSRKKTAASPPARRRSRKSPAR